MNVSTFWATERPGRLLRGRRGARGSGKAGPVGMEDWKHGEAGTEKLPSKTRQGWRQLAGTAFTSFHPGRGIGTGQKNWCVSEDGSFQTGDHDLPDSDKTNQPGKISILSE